MNSYGTIETNPLVDGREYHKARQETVTLGDKRLARVTRLRLLTERGYPLMDVSYCHGVLKDGTPVRVDLPVHQLSRRFPKDDLIRAAKSEGVYAKGLGLLDESNWSVLYG